MREKLTTDLRKYVEEVCDPDEVSVVLTMLRSVNLRDADRLYELFTLVHGVTYEPILQETQEIALLLSKVGLIPEIIDQLIGAIADDGRAEKRRLQPVTVIADSDIEQLIEMAIEKLEAFGLIYQIVSSDYVFGESIKSVLIKPTYIPRNVLNPQGLFLGVLLAGKTIFNTMEPEIDLLSYEDIRESIKHAMKHALMKQLGE